MKQPVQLVIFDLGRVLMRLCDSWQHACELAQVQTTARLDDPVIAGEVHVVNNEFESGRLSTEAYFNQVGQITGLSPDEVGRVMTAWLREPFPGVIDLVEELIQANGVQVACLSNTNDLHWRLMHEDPRHRLPLAKMNHAFASHLIGCMKPDSAIYEHVEYHTGLSAASILFFDDNADNITAARQRGWRAIQIDTTRDPAQQIREALSMLDGL